MYGTHIDVSGRAARANADGLSSDESADWDTSDSRRVSGSFARKLAVSARERACTRSRTHANTRTSPPTRAGMRTQASMAHIDFEVCAEDGLSKMTRQIQARQLHTHTG
jgi:hypothetical protein